MLYSGDTKLWPPGLYVANSSNGPVKAIVQPGKPTLFRKSTGDDTWRKAYNNFLGLSYVKIADL